ncbi:MAG: dephospho-CoA kinase [Flavobacteriales bacterium]|nr:dephospho-CoA kinase [Flavobacteriales bacterium]
MKVVGITGGIGSGKTTVAQVFASMSISVFNSDAQGRRVLDNDMAVIAAVKKLLGEEVYLPEGRADRKAIASKVFADPVLLESLNAIIHPAVKRSTEAWVMALPAGTAYCLKEAAILFESGAASQCDHLIAVRADDAIRIQRIMDRDGVSHAEVEARMKSQWAQEKVAALSDYVVDNSGERSLIQQVVRIHRLLSSQGQ